MIRSQSLPTWQPDTPAFGRACFPISRVAPFAFSTPLLGVGEGDEAADAGADASKTAATIPIPRLRRILFSFGLGGLQRECRLRLGTARAADPSCYLTEGPVLRPTPDFLPRRAGGIPPEAPKQQASCSLGAAGPVPEGLSARLWVERMRSRKWKAQGEGKETVRAASNQLTITRMTRRNAPAYPITLQSVVPWETPFSTAPSGPFSMIAVLGSSQVKALMGQTVTSSAHRFFTSPTFRYTASGSSARARQALSNAVTAKATRAFT